MPVLRSRRMSTKRVTNRLEPLLPHMLPEPTCFVRNDPLWNGAGAPLGLRSSTADPSTWPIALESMGPLLWQDRSSDRIRDCEIRLRARPRSPEASV